MTTDDDDDDDGTYAIGDSHEIECLACHKNIDLTYISTDGCLKKGFEDVCEHCGAKYVITSVEYYATVCAEFK
jgi:hypothetical protein